MSEEIRIEISTDLLAAVAKWASGDMERAISAVVFRDGEMIATNGHRLVRVPWGRLVEVNGAPCLGVQRRDLLAAIAAQNVLERDDLEPAWLDHDIGANLDGDSVLADGPYGDRKIVIRTTPSHIVIDLGYRDVQLRVLPADLTRFPAGAVIDKAMPTPTGESPPDGIIFQPRYLAALDEIATAAHGRASGVRCKAWSDHHGGMLFETITGVRMAIMPMKPFEDQK